jgi:Kef-type K+ transport system membrane component KefB
MRPNVGRRASFRKHESIKTVICLLLLFMSRVEFHYQSVEETIAPISRQFLIPIFFVSLGLMINVWMVFSCWHCQRCTARLR